jgi:hypothetical protein
MRKTNTMVSYFTKITELKDQLVAIGTKMEGKYLVYIALNGLASTWMSFFQYVYACETLPNFAKLWVNLV